jgi:Spy/CpxP family protein refolding chaperone
MFQRLLSGSVFSLALPLALASIALFPGNAAAGEKHSRHDREGRDGKHIEKFIAKLEKELELSPTQAAQVREILKPDSALVPPETHTTRHGPGPGPGMGMGMFDEEYMNQLREDRVDTAALNRGFAERQASLQARHDRMVFKFVQLHGVLNLVQRAKLADILEKHRAEMRARMEKQEKKAAKERRKK